MSSRRGPASTSSAGGELESLLSAEPEEPRDRPLCTSGSPGRRSSAPYPLLPQYFRRIGHLSAPPGEALAAGGNSVRYLQSEEEREQYRLYVSREGLLVGGDGELLAPQQTLEAMYVMDRSGVILVSFSEHGNDSAHKPQRQLRHSSLVNGAPVMAAGQLTVRCHTRC